MRYRGPYEYEKFILNVLQYHNEILRMKKELGEQNDKNIAELTAKLDKICNKFDELSEELLVLREKATAV
jgi:hypothetical protein